ncbi:electron transport complex protein RnfC [Dethiosulfatibacter aminovorans DSM 17477]|uniref:Ion-translocating oxidoreductase complex subunit C n=1 Tax=Dethiosulfatibacter aminovorans DSM 17477 TaxID=1121476 RepID=A0A1M6KJT6_9FIRM|nr:electron transport complex subunit RsxC [Dethiosulfatibacter aminovorans]SHJ59081.1 electron transport complex protein RnfC [Dethiosulfatibacter aminovorans DSM 17477]
MSKNGLTFRGGIHPPHFKKQTETKAIEAAPVPSVVVIPLAQHIGAPCDPVVKVGDSVKVGQKIGESQAFVSSPIHSSVSGTVKKIELRQSPGGAKVKSIVIESDGLMTVDESVKPRGTVDSLSPEELKGIIKECGLTGMGGAGFPTHVKLSPPKEKPIDIVIINGAECEPYLTSDHRVMLEMPEKVVQGTLAVMKVLGVEKGVIGIEGNKPDAIKSMKDAVKDYPALSVAELQTKYPQGGEKSLIFAVTGREVPSGGLPMDVGAVVQNISTVAAISDAVLTGMPVVERVVTITGSAVKEPKNLMVKMGTSFNEVVEFCGGYTEDLGKIINGGPMMGIAQYTGEVPVIKGTSGILVLNKKDAERPQESNCIRCGKCVDACPSGLQPFMISKNTLLGRYEEAEAYNAMDCIECGSCSFVCPAKRPLVDAIRIAKKEIIAKRKRG